MANESTTIITNIEEALASSEQEASNNNAALLGVGGDLNGSLFDLPDGEITFGRAPDNTIPLEFAGISRNHMKCVVEEETVTLHDMGSKNGTFVNNKKIEGPVPLNKGDIVKIGNLAFRFIPKGDPERLTYDKLNLDANTDGLTGCYNKAYFNNACDLEVKKSKATGQPLSVILFDLDHFKYLNDNFGHDAGDFVLKELSSVIRSGGVRDKDIFARYGGEEFVILLPETNLKQCFEIAERLRKLVEDHNFIYDGKKLPVTASIGTADFRPGVESGTDLFKRADQAVYISKKNGRNQVNFYKE